jgi:hypothetical protein
MVKSIKPKVSHAKASELSLGTKVIRNGKVFVVFLGDKGQHYFRKSGPLRRKHRGFNCSGFKY